LFTLLAVKAFRIFVISVAVLAIGSASAKPPKAQPAPPQKQAVEELEYQVAALKLLRELDPSSEQVQAITAAAKSSAGKPGAIPAAPAEYKTALSEYADALADGDEDKIDTAEDKVDDLRDSLKVEPLPDIAPTEGARSAADKIVALLTPAQLANYIAEHADEVPGPVQTLLDAADQSRSSSGDDFAALKSEAAGQFAMLVAGVSTADAGPVESAAAAWLEQIKAMSDKQYDAGLDERTRQVKAMAHGVDSFVVLRHWMDREMVDLLSNPQLSSAAKRLKI
jgi:hypothetical protein